jgi:hypothetical protein
MLGEQGSCQEGVQGVQQWEMHVKIAALGLIVFRVNSIAPGHNARVTNYATGTKADTPINR